MNPLSIFALALESHRLHPEDLDPEQLSQLKTELPGRIFDQAARRYSELRGKGVEVISYLDPAYPEPLKRTNRPLSSGHPSGTALTLGRHSRKPQLFKRGTGVLS